MPITLLNTGGGTGNFKLINNNGSGRFSAVLGVTGQLWITGSESTTLSLTASNNGTFTSVTFASYGTPTGIYPNFVTSSCNAATSVARVSAAFIGKTNGSIAATNAVFGDPCPGIGKRLYIILTYTYYA
jgi:hypothetical protein